MESGGVVVDRCWTGHSWWLGGEWRVLASTGTLPSPLGFPVDFHIGVAISCREQEELLAGVAVGDRNCSLK
jgi:hypothetical protein